MIKFKKEAAPKCSIIISNEQDSTVSSSDIEVLNHTVKAFGFLIQPGEELSPQLFASRITSIYDADHPKIKHYLYVLDKVSDEGEK